MTLMYGKKRRGLLLSSGFGNDESSKDQTAAYDQIADQFPQGLSTNEKDRKRDSLVSITSITRAARVALGDTTPFSARTSMPHDVSPVETKPSAPSIPGHEDRGMPLPLPESNRRLPDKYPVDEAVPRVSSSKKIKKVKAGKEEKLKTRPVISNPMPIISHESATMKAGPIPSFEIKTSDAAINSKNTTTLQQEAFAEHEHDKRFAKGRKAPALHRGKEVFVKAAQAISDRLNSSAEKRKKKENDSFASLDLNHKEVPGTAHCRLEDAGQSIIDRRIAEGRNLGNAKIRSLTGDGNVRRKPLPVYDSMKSTKSIDETFSDEQDLNDNVETSKDFSDFDFGLGKRKVKKAGTLGDNVMALRTHSPLEALSHGAQRGGEYSSRISRNLSGLAQHPDTTSFSSSPDGYSTPRIRLEPTIDSNGKKKLVGVLSSRNLDPNTSLSLPKLSFEDDSEGDQKSTHPSTKVDNRKLRLKRKSATEDLRTHSPLTLKKARKLSETDFDDLTQAPSKGPSGKTNRGALAPKDKNKKISVSTDEPRGNGRNFFEMGKGRSPLTSMVDMIKTRGKLSRTSSVRKPTRETSVRRGASHAAEDDNDVDELQMDVSTHRVGGRNS